MFRAISTTLGSGLTARIEEDRHNPGCFLLVVDEIPQSQINLDDPSELFFEYVRRIGNVIDLIQEPGQAITAVHFGAGALTLPRYVEATRPGSRQQVIELESKLVDFVREHLPLPPKIDLRIRYGDARQLSGKLPAGLQGSVDLIVSDVFAGADTPKSVTSVEYYRTLSALLKETGVLTVNIGDGYGLNFARAKAATLAEVFNHVAILADSSLFKGHRYGNLVMVASDTEFPDDWYRRLMSAGPHPAKVMMGNEVTRFASAALPITDEQPFPGRIGITQNFIIGD